MRLLLITLALILCSCGLQLGKYTVSGSGFNVLEPGFGIIAMVHGRPFAASTPDQTLLCIIALCPDLKTGPGGDSSSSAWTFTSSARYSWPTQSGKLTFGYSWNRATDKVEIADSHFSRAAGNVYVARCDGGGGWRVQQLSAVTALDAREALREIQQKLPEDRYIAQLSISL
jgi:hypothetical protein